MKTKIITAIYNGLFGTELGGRPGRNTSYMYSLKSLMKMSDADFVCYTSTNDITELENFFYTKHNFPKDRIIFKIFDLYNIEYSEKLNKLKDIESVKKSDRCFEIQYSKFIWLENELDDVYDYFYWFDAGLSHNGLIPNKYLLTTSDDVSERYYESSLFNDDFLSNLLDFTGEEITVVGKNNEGEFYWCRSVPQKYYIDMFNNTQHIIGGFFGGKKDIIKNYCQLFSKYLNDLLDNETELYPEEMIMSLIYVNHIKLFKTLQFDLWWHENQIMPGIDDMPEHVKNKRSFYKILEDLNKKI